MLNHTIELTIICPDPATREILIASLSHAGAEGFEEKENELLVFFQEEESLEKELAAIIQENSLPFSRKLLPAQNWNQSWESNFQPVIVEDLVGIRADFHEPIQGVGVELLITPKMSFGTGHHATTHLMIRSMMDLDFSNKMVLDFGTGTGVLAILAEKLGAGKVIAIDNDEWSILNARENLEKNASQHIEIKQADELLGFKEPFDIILANINRHVILENLPSLKRLLKRGGTLVLSGLLKEDREDMKQALLHQQIEFLISWERGDWICIKARH